MFNITAQLRDGTHMHIHSHTCMYTPTYTNTCHNANMYTHTCTHTHAHTHVQVVVILRIVFFLLMLVCNTLMWTLFVRALQGCQSTVEATVTNSASNFFFTVRSWLGSSLVGVSLVSHFTLFLVGEGGGWLEKV